MFDLENYLDEQGLPEWAWQITFCASGRGNSSEKEVLAIRSLTEIIRSRLLSMGERSFVHELLRLCLEKAKPSIQEDTYDILRAALSGNEDIDDIRFLLETELGEIQQSPEQGFSEAFLDVLEGSKERIGDVIEDLFSMSGLRDKKFEGWISGLLNSLSN